MNTTMCSTSRIEPVRELAGTASALRIDSGSIVTAAAAPADVAAVFRKRRRLLDVMMLLPSSRGMGINKGITTRIHARFFFLFDSVLRERRFNGSLRPARSEEQARPAGCRRRGLPAR